MRLESIYVRVPFVVERTETMSSLAMTGRGKGTFVSTHLLVLVEMEAPALSVPPSRLPDLPDLPGLDFDPTLELLVESLIDGIE